MPKEIVLPGGVRLTFKPSGSSGEAGEKPKRDLLAEAGLRPKKTEPKPTTVIEKERETQEKETPPSLEIGKSSYCLSEEALRFIARISVPRTKYESSRSIVIAEEPHYDADAQFRVYKFLEAFFNDYPQLVPKTVFLAEGFPANQVISIKPLIEIEPNPDEELISRVLETFLIPGYVAYEWKHRKNIPIVGIENLDLYRASSSLWPETTEEKTKKDLEWLLTVCSRNYPMATTLLEKIRTYENPILFVGSLHLSADFELQQWKELLISRDLRTFRDPSERERLLKRLEDCQSTGLHDYLKNSRVWWQSLCFSLGGPETSKDENTYRKLFRAQLGGNYADYIGWFVSKKLFSVTTRPSPETAAQFVRAYRNYLKEHPLNLEARKFEERGLSLAKAGRFVEAAEEFSAASAAEPRIQHYVANVQLALFEEARLRYGELFPPLPKTPGIVHSFELVIDKVPILGPYTEKDHFQKVQRFAQRFIKIPGAKEVIDNADGSSWIYRLGAGFQIKVAEALGPENIKGFEEEHRPKGEDINKVDIVTKDNIAIECKNFIKRMASPGQIRQWTEQASRRFESDQKGHKYNGALLVIPDNKDLQEIETKINEYLRVFYPGLLNKTKICRLAEVKEVLSRLMRK